MKKTLVKQLSLLFVVAFCATSCGHGHFDKNRIEDHITYLASDELEGRGTQTKGDSLAAIYIAGYFKELGLTPKGENNSWFQPFSFEFNHNPWDTTKKYVTTMKSKNVIGFLDNGAKYTIVIGAHYDHMGRGKDSSYILDKKAYGKIHNGADDNASGVAGILELAHYYATNGFKEKNNFLFIAFGAEEMGLKGSEAFCEKPTIKLANINYMINLDMIGRLSSRWLTIEGVVSAPQFVPVTNKIHGDFTIYHDSVGLARSDYFTFYEKNIPALQFFTGFHDDYHKATDDVEKINFRGEVKILEYIRKLVYTLDPLPKLRFQKYREWRKPRYVALGVYNEFSYKGKGARIFGLDKNGYFAKYGLEKGDVVLQIGDTTILNYKTLNWADTWIKENDTLPVIYKRNNVVDTVIIPFKYYYPR